MIGSLIGGFIGQGGANQAANTAQNAANQAYLGQQHQMEVNRSDASPWTSAGRQSINDIGALLGWGDLRANGSGNSGTLDFVGSNAEKTQALADATKRYNAFNTALAGTTPASAPKTPGFDELVTPWNFTADPGYQFRLSEGNKALDRSAASKGMLLSGAQLKGVNDYNQNMASNEYANWWNRYTSSVAANNAKRQQDYANQFGQYQDTANRELTQRQNYLNLLSGTAGLGGNMQSGVNSANSGLQSQGGNFLQSAGQYAGNAQMAGANALASGIGNGINNAMFGLGMLNPGDIFSNSALGGGRSGYR